MIIAIIFVTLMAFSFNIDYMQYSSGESPDWAVYMIVKIAFFILALLNFQY